MRIKPLLTCAFMLVVTWLFAYHTVRHEFWQVWLVFTSLFLGYFTLIWSNFKLSLRQGIGLAIVLRLIFLPSTPVLSDDVYRFLWDGLLMLDGMSPYAFLPSQISVDSISGIDSALFAAMNSPDYYSVYPPVSQWIFAGSGWISGGDLDVFLIALRTLFIGSELLIFYILYRLLKFRKVSTYPVLFYALNPLVIIEGVGNLHFEVIMICFALSALYLFLKNRLLIGVVCLALSISIKLVSLILWPFMIPVLGWRKWIMGSVVLVGLLLLLFYPLWEANYLLNYTESIRLYFKTFEFNASIYYIFRALGIWMKGYNLIAIIGPLLSVLSIIGLAIFLIKTMRRTCVDFVVSCFVFGFIWYLLCSTTVHPWYLLLPLAFACLTRQRSLIIWSAVIWLSYHAYSFNPVTEMALIVALEYVVLVYALYCERHLLSCHTSEGCADTASSYRNVDHC